MDNLIIKTESLQKSFKKGGEQLHVLKNIDLEVAEGEFVALMGASGSGKSTLLNLLGGLDICDSGTIYFDNAYLHNLNERQLTKLRGNSIGFIFQHYHLMPILTASGNVELPLLLTKLSKRERIKRVDAALDLVGLADRSNHKPNQLSGGQEQRVGIARAIVNNPKLLLCDEPTGDLDQNSTNQILDLLTALSKEYGKTIIMVTHDPNAGAVTDRILWLKDGALAREH